MTVEQVYADLDRYAREGNVQQVAQIARLTGIEATRLEEAGDQVMASRWHDLMWRAAQVHQDLRLGMVGDDGEAA
jgi:hypothetical protein